MTALNKQALIAKIKKQTESFDTVVLQEDEATSLLDELEAAEKYAKDRDDENKDLMLTVGRLRVEKEAAEKRIAELTEKPIGWTDEQELRDVEKLGCGYLFNANPITPHADPRRVILLYAAAAGKGE